MDPLVDNVLMSKDFDLDLDLNLGATPAIDLTTRKNENRTPTPELDTNFIKWRNPVIVIDDETTSLPSSPEQIDCYESPEQVKSSIQKDVDFIKKHVPDADSQFLYSLLVSQVDSPNRLESVMCDILGVVNGYDLIQEYRQPKVGDKRTMPSCSALVDGPTEVKKRRVRDNMKDNEYFVQIRNMFPDVDQFFLSKECEHIKSAEDCSRFVNTVMLTDIYPQQGAVNGVWDVPSDDNSNSDMEVTSIMEVTPIMEVTDKSSYRTVQLIDEEDDESKTTTSKGKQESNEEKHSSDEDDDVSFLKKEEKKNDEIEVLNVKKPNTTKTTSFIDLISDTTALYTMPEVDNLVKLPEVKKPKPTATVTLGGGNKNNGGNEVNPQKQDGGFEKKLDDALYDVLFNAPQAPLGDSLLDFSPYKPSTSVLKTKTTNIPNQSTSSSSSSSSAFQSVTNVTINANPMDPVRPAQFSSNLFGSTLHQEAHHPILPIYESVDDGLSSLLSFTSSAMTNESITKAKKSEKYALQKNILDLSVKDDRKNLSDDVKATPGTSVPKIEPIASIKLKRNTSAEKLEDWQIISSNSLKEGNELVATTSTCKAVPLTPAISIPAAAPQAPVKISGNNLAKREATITKPKVPEATTVVNPELLSTSKDEAPQPPAIDENEKWLEEQVANLIRIFPNTDPMFLRSECSKFDKSSDAVNEFVLSKLENNDMPTRAEYEKRMEMEELQNRYTKNFSIEDFLKAVPDPWTYFSDTKRNCLKYKNHTVCYLKSAFRKHYAKDITDTIQKYNSNLYLAYQHLKNTKMSLRQSKRTEYECNSNRPNNIDIQFLQEVAFIENEDKIKGYIEAQKLAKQLKFDEAKASGTLLECQCCFDSEVLVEDTVYCPNDHSFCKDCVIKSVEVGMGSGKCQFECLAGCNEKFSLASLQSVLKPEVFSKVIQANQMEEIKAAGIEDLVQCPFCNYATIMPPEQRVMTCLNPECLKESCRLCKELNHIPLRCDEVEKSEDVKLRTYIENKMTEALIRTCYKCQKKFVKEDGCNKMTCTCGAKMCYVCRKPVTDYSHFNGQGGSDFHKCPLYSTNDELHVEAVKKEAEKAKAEVLQANPEKKLKHDPTAILPKRSNDAPMPGMNFLNLAPIVHRQIPHQAQLQAIQQAVQQVHQARAVRNDLINEVARVRGIHPVLAQHRVHVDPQRHRHRHGHVPGHGQNQVRAHQQVQQVQQQQQHQHQHQQLPVYLQRQQPNNPNRPY